jgi:hypothetical protein
MLSFKLEASRKEANDPGEHKSCAQGEWVASKHLRFHAQRTREE